MTDQPLTERLKADLTAAMKDRDAMTTSTLRLLRSAIMNAEVAGDKAAVLTEDQALEILQGEAKRRSDAAAAYAQAGRSEAAAKERAERDIIETYLPAKMSPDELEKLVDEQIAVAAQDGVDGPRAMGQVIKAVMSSVGAAADGGTVAALVKSKLVN